jgi:hypothetical protein
MNIRVGMRRFGVTALGLLTFCLDGEGRAGLRWSRRSTTVLTERGTVIVRRVCSMIMLTFTLAACCPQDNDAWILWGQNWHSRGDGTEFVGPWEPVRIYPTLETCQTGFGIAAVTNRNYICLLKGQRPRQ